MIIKYNKGKMFSPANPNLSNLSDGYQYPSCRGQTTWVFQTEILDLLFHTLLKTITDWYSQ